MPGALLILQAGAAAAMAPPAAAAPLPTIELRARVRADSLRVEQQGEARLTVTADPLLARTIDVRRSRPVPGGVTVKDVDVTLHATVTIDPAARSAAASVSSASVSSESVSSSPGEPTP